MTEASRAVSVCAVVHESTPSGAAPLSHVRPLIVVYEGEAIPRNVPADRVVVVDMASDGTVAEAVSYSRRFQVSHCDVEMGAAAAAAAAAMSASPARRRAPGEGEGAAKNVLTATLLLPPISARIDTATADEARADGGGSTVLACPNGGSLVINIHGVSSAP